MVSIRPRDMRTRCRRSYLRAQRLGVRGKKKNFDVHRRTGGISPCAGKRAARLVHLVRDLRVEEGGCAGAEYVRTRRPLSAKHTVSFQTYCGWLYGFIFDQRVVASLRLGVPAWHAAMQAMPAHAEMIHSSLCAVDPCGMHPCNAPMTCPTYCRDHPGHLLH